MSKTITICGSMMFAKRMQELKETLESWGWQVYLPEISEKSGEYLMLPLEKKLQAKNGFITNHFNRIKQSDAILVANYEKNNIKGYIGSNTLMEIAVAHVLEKKVYILFDLDPQRCEDEVRALVTKILNGNLTELKN